MSSAKFLIVLAFVTLGAVWPARAQMAGGGRGRGSRGTAARASGAQSPEQLLPSLPGKVTAMDGKTLSIEGTEGNPLDLHCSKKTKYYDGNKQIKATDIKPGDEVSVEVRHAPDMSLDAVVVRLQRPKAS